MFMVMMLNIDIFSRGFYGDGGRVWDGDPRTELGISLETRLARLCNYTRFHGYSVAAFIFPSMLFCSFKGTIYKEWCASVRENLPIPTKSKTSNPLAPSLRYVHDTGCDGVSHAFVGNTIDSLLIPTFDEVLWISLLSYTALSPMKFLLMNS